MTPELRKRCEQRKAELLAERDVYRQDWQQVAEYVDPYAGRFLTQATDGPRKASSRAKIINSEATRSVRVMDAGFMGGHTSKSRPWFLLTVGSPALKERAAVKAWCDDVAQAIRDVLAKSNFYTALPDFYHSRHLFGIGALMVSDDDKDTVRFYNRLIGTYAIGLDDRGICDTFYYSFTYTASQIRSAYSAAMGGDDKLPQGVREALNTGRLGAKFTIHCLLEPNPDAKAGMQPRHLRPFRHVFWMEGGAVEDSCGCLFIDGFYEFRALASRWAASGNDCYGPAPAIDALGDIKQLQYLEGEKLRIIDLISKPSLQMPDYMRGRGGSANPGERIYLTPMQTQAEVRPVYTPDPRGLAAVQAEIAVVTDRIKAAFFVDLFRMLDTMDDRERTAYELSERKEEKVAMLGPSLESLTDEVLDPNVSLVYAIMDRKGLIPPPPEELNGVPLVIEYTSMLAQVQKAAGLGTIERVIGFVGQAAAQSQRMDLFDKLDLEQAIDEYADRAGSPARIVRSDDDVAKIRQDRMAASKQAQMAQMAPALKDGAQAVKTLGETVPQQGSALSGLAEALGQA